MARISVSAKLCQMSHMHYACRGLIDGATTLELDNGITQDGEVVVWHDEEIMSLQCQDTSPAVGLPSPFMCHVADDQIE